MKKLFISICLLLIGTSFIFADRNPKGEEMVEKFLNYGTYVKLIAKDDDDVNYYYKPQIVSIQVDDDDLEFRMIISVETFGGRDNNEPSFSFSKFNITSDENGNIIITKK